MSKFPPKPGPISAKPLGILLDDVFAEAYAKQGFAARELVTRWAQIAGAEIAAHARQFRRDWEKLQELPYRPAEELNSPLFLPCGVNGTVSFSVFGSTPSGLFWPATCSAQTCSTTTPAITNGSR